MFLYDEFVLNVLTGKNSSISSAEEDEVLFSHKSC